MIDSKDCLAGFGRIGFFLVVLVLSTACSQPSGRTLIPAPGWDCYLPDGIPSPETGSLVFDLEIPLDRAADVGRTPFGDRSIAVGRAGTIVGPRLTGEVMAGALDYQLVLGNGVIEIEQNLVLRTADGSFVYARNAGTGADPADVRVVMDFEAPNDSASAWLNAGVYVARRDLDVAAGMLTVRVYDVTGVAVDRADALRIVKPDGVPAQPWNNRVKSASERPGDTLIRENVTLAPGQSVGPSKRGIRNIIPITGGELSGRISGRPLMGGADYQILTPPATIDARYLWQTDDGEIIIVRNGGAFGALVPTFEARVDGPHAYLNEGRYLSSNPEVGQGGVALTFFESSD